MSIKYHYGIDFGTTNSSVSFMPISDGGGLPHPLHFGDEEGRPIPSTVAIDRKTGTIYTGRDAWNKRRELSDTCECIQSVKLLLDKDGWAKDIAGKHWTAEDVATEVFKNLKEATNRDNENYSMDSATVAVPIGFNAKKRATLRRAAERAGVAIEAFVSEPTAAFCANYEALRGAQHVVVFDWGGGTLDVSVLKISGGRIYELSTAGMPVAGDDIDEAVARKIHTKVAAAKGVTISFDDMPAQSKDRMLVRAERAKRDLSDEDDTVVSLNKYGELGAFRQRLTYEEFSAIVDSIVNDAIDCLDKAIADSGEPEANIDTILMVGGSSNIGPLLERLDERFGDKLYFPEETVWNISSGAAQLSYMPGKHLCAQKVGLRLADDSYFPLIMESDPVTNWKKELTFGLVDTSQEIRVVFAGSKDIEESESHINSLKVPGYAFLEERLQLIAEIDENMIFRVTMKSSMRPDRDAVVWEYDKLKLSYELGISGR